MPNIRKPAFVGGELSAELWGRTDLDRFVTSAARIENFLPIAEGGAQKRYGTTYIDACRYSDRKAWLIPFRFNEDQAYFLEFGDEYIKVFARNENTKVSGVVVGNSEPLDNATRGVISFLEWTTTGPDFDDADLPFDGTYIQAWGIDDWESLPEINKVIMASTASRVVTGITVESDEYNEGSGLYSVRVTRPIAWPADLKVGSPVSFSGITGVGGFIDTLNAKWYRVTAIVNENVFVIDTDVGGADDETVPGSANLERPYPRGFYIDYNTTGWPKDGTNGYWRHYAQVDSPYADTDVSQLEFDQSADVMTLTHRDYVPRELKRYGHAQWELEQLWLYPRMRGPDSIIVQDLSMWGRIPTSIAGSVWVGPTAPAAGSDENWPAGYGYVALQYEVTAISEDTGEESIATYGHYIGAGPDLDYIVIGAPSAAIGGPTGWEDITTRIRWKAVPGASGYNVYKRDAFGGRDYSFIGHVIAQRDDYEDFEDRWGTDTRGDFFPLRPSWGDNAPARIARNPFGNVDGTDTCPRAVAIYQQRRFFAGTDAQPQGVFSSQSAAYNNYNFSTPSQASDAITAVIAAQQIDPIVHLVKMRRLIIMTSGGEWYVEGDESGGLTPSNFEPIPQSSHGSSTVKPMLIGGTVLFVEANERRIRDMAYEYTSDSYTGNELTVMARHLFDDNRIVDWAYQKSPHSILYVIRDDGVLLTLTYMKEHQVWAWARHTSRTDTAPSRYESVVCIPEGNEDGVYAVVRRYIGDYANEFTDTRAGQYVRYIERINPGLDPSNQHPDTEKRFYPMHLDCAVTLEGESLKIHDIHPGTGGNAARAELSCATGSLDQWETVYIQIAEGAGADAVSGYWTVDIIVDSVDPLVGRAALLPVGFNPPPPFPVLDDYLQFDDLTEYLGEAHQTFQSSGEDRYHQLRRMLPSAVPFASIDHLNRELVAVVGDGNRLDDWRIDNGDLILSSECWIAHIGLPYDGIIETLPLHDARGGLAGKRFSVPAVSIESYRTRGYEVGPIGAADDEYRTYASRSEGYMETADSVTDERRVEIPPGWGKRGRLSIRHRDPLPCNLISITPKVVTEDER